MGIAGWQSSSRDSLLFVDRLNAVLLCVLVGSSPHGHRLEVSAVKSVGCKRRVIHPSSSCPAGPRTWLAEETLPPSLSMQLNALSKFVWSAMVSAVDATCDESTEAGQDRWQP